MTIPWYKSKTIWFNAITLILGILVMTEFTAIVPASFTIYIVFANAVGNLILRTFFTSEPIKK